MMVSFRLLLALFLFACPALAAASPTPVPIETVTTVRNLSDVAEWCESDLVATVEAVAAGACRFKTAGPGDLVRGFSRRAFWLRLSFDNQSPALAIRWLLIGYPALLHVNFYEAVGTGFIDRGEAGLATAVSARPLSMPDPMVPVILAPGQGKILWVRVASETSLDMTPTLWLPDNYLEAVQSKTVIVALAIGGMLITAGFTGIMFFFERDSTYLFFVGTWLSKALFTASYAVLIPNWVPIPLHDLAVLAAGAMILCSALFACGFVGESEYYRNHHRLLIASAILTAVLALATCLIDFRVVTALRMVALCSTLISLALFWRAWRRGSIAAGFTFWASAVPFAVQLVLAAAAFGVARFSDVLPVIDTCARLLTAPLALYGIAVRREHLMRALAGSRAENAARLDFLARMSHELRAPLDTILEIAQLLARPDGRSRLDADLDDIQESGWRLLRMIDDILDYARGLAGRLTVTPEEVDWMAFLKDVTQDGQRLAAKNSNVFRLRTNGELVSHLRLDPVRLRQVLDNLLRNAARHTRDGEIVLTCVTECPDQTGRLRLGLTVADTGEGIAPEDIDRIFRPFERGRNTSRNDGRGIGMGLAIARQLVDRMGGRLTVESIPGHGASFHFDIVVEIETESAFSENEVERIVSGYTGRHRTILLVDDQERNRAIVARLLRTLGFTVIEASSGREANELCATSDVAVDLVLTDQMMPDGDGWSLLAAFAETRPEVPVVMFSAKPPVRPEGFPASLNFAAMLMKPIDHARLVDLLGEKLGLDWRSVAPPVSSPVRLFPRPTEDDLAAFRALVATGQVSAIADWADVLALRDKKFAAFADAVKTAARQLDFKALDQLAEAGSK